MGKIVLRNSKIIGYSILNSPGLWTPENITKSLWMDAQDSSTIILNGSSVSQWNDKSGNNWHFTNTSGSTQPTYNVNKISFNGVNQQRLFNLNLGAKQIFRNKSKGTIVSVVKYTTRSTGNICLFFGTPTTGNSRFTLHSGSINPGYLNTNYGVAARRLDSDSFKDLSSNSFDTNLPIIIQMGQADWQTGQLIQYINGSEDVIDNSFFQTTGSTSDTDSANVTIGAAPLGGYALIGDVHEILVFDNILTLTERQKLEGYLAHKWNLTSQLPVNHPYKNQRPRI